MRDAATGRFVAGVTTPAVDRIMKRVVFSDVPFRGSPCWIFTGAKVGGYGTVGVGPRGAGNILTHRATYQHFVGDVPDGLELDHLCRVRSCCNPAHLEAVTRHVNIMRGDGPRVTRQLAAGMTHCRRGHERNETNTYVSSKGVHRCRPCQKITDAARRAAA